MGVFYFEKIYDNINSCNNSFSIISWGLIGVNIENTEAFNNQNYELSEKVDYDRIKRRNRYGFNYI